MKLQMIGGLSAAALLLFGAAFSANATDPGDCVQYPIYADGSGNYLWFSDHYDDQTMCGDLYASEGYLWASDMLQAPQICGSCAPLQVSLTPNVAKNTREARVDAVCHKLQSPLPVNHQFKNTIPASVKASNMSVWTPANAAVVSSVYYVQVISTSNAPLNVKLYVVDVDFAAVSLPPTAYKIQKHRIMAGFEITKIPSSVNSETVPLVKAVKPANTPATCKTEGLVSIDQEVKPFRIITSRDISF
jgi:hypothetical protein